MAFEKMLRTFVLWILLTASGWPPFHPHMTSTTTSSSSCNFIFDHATSTGYCCRAERHSTCPSGYPNTDANIILNSKSALPRSAQAFLTYVVPKTSFYPTVSYRHAKSLSLLSLTDSARPERPAAIETIQNQYDSPLIITKYAFMKQQEHGKTRQKFFWTFTTITTQRNDTPLYLQQHSTLRRSRIWLLDLETRNTASVLSFIDFYDLHQRVAMISFSKDLNFPLAICFLARERASTQLSTTLYFWFWISA